MGEVILQKKNLQKEKKPQVNQSDKEAIITNSRTCLNIAWHFVVHMFCILVFTLLLPLTANFKACIIWRGFCLSFWLSYLTGSN